VTNIGIENWRIVNQGGLLKGNEDARDEAYVGGLVGDRRPGNRPSVQTPVSCPRRQWGNNTIQPAVY
jgi:hypothetical protein